MQLFFADVQFNVGVALLNLTIWHFSGLRLLRILILQKVSGTLRTEFSIFCLSPPFFVRLSPFSFWKRRVLCFGNSLTLGRNFWRGNLEGREKLQRKILTDFPMRHGRDSTITLWIQFQIRVLSDRGAIIYRQFCANA